MKSIHKVAARLRELALGQFGCLDFQAVTEGNQEIALSYWPNEESIMAWKSHAEHLLAQQLGRERWYESYTVQIANITREYSVSDQQTGVAADSKRELPYRA